MSAEAAKGAFEEIKKRLLSTGGNAVKKCSVVLATVKGDIHDIGKNIVATLLENYGFEVIDLGKDVTPERIAEETAVRHAPIVGLSALMTTTLPSMEETVKLLKTRAPWAKIMVGGAVLTEDYAQRIGADGYGKDGMSAVRFAERIYTLLCKK
jgi:5-methyltetrahydrofolate--homocysteine methyltransferase